MADTSNYPNSALDDGLPRPVASLTDLPIRRPLNADPARAAKPGDLTEELNKRRGQSPMNGAVDIEVTDPASEALAPVTEIVDAAVEAPESVAETIEAVAETVETTADSPPPNGDAPESVTETAAPAMEDGMPTVAPDAAEPVSDAAEPVFEAAEPVFEAAESASDVAEPHASPAAMDDAAPPAGTVGTDAAADADSYVDDAPVQELTIETVPAAPQQPAPMAMQQLEPGDDGQAVVGNGVEPSPESASGTSMTGTELRKRMSGQQDETPQAPAMSSEESGPGGAEAETSAPQDDDGAEAPSDESSAKGRFRLSKKQERETVLRSRMAAVLEKETRRREAWEARRMERGEEAPSAPPLPQRPVTQQYDDIFRYWSSERRGRPLPALSNLDQDVIARQWPDTLLLRYTAGSNHLELTRNFAKPEGEGDSANAPAGKIDFTPSVIEWVLSQGRAAANEENPVRATEELDTRWGTAQYKVVALPLAEDGRAIDHVLCHIEPA